MIGSNKPIFSNISEWSILYTELQYTALSQHGINFMRVENDPTNGLDKLLTKLVHLYN